MSIWRTLLEATIPEFGRQRRRDEYADLIGTMPSYAQNQPGVMTHAMPQQGPQIAQGGLNDQVYGMPPGLLAPQAQPAQQAMIAGSGSGLLGGGDYSPERMAQHWASTGAIGGMYGDMGMQQMGLGTRHTQSLDQDQAQYMYGMNNISATDAAKMQALHGVNSRSFAETQQQNQIKNANMIADDIRATSDKMGALIAPDQRVLTLQENTRDSIEKLGWNHKSTAADLSMITALSKALKPPESVMSDDIANTLQGMGFSADITQTMQQIFQSGSGMLSPTQRQQIMAEIDNLAGLSARRISEVASQADSHGQNYGQSPTYLSDTFLTGPRHADTRSLPVRGRTGRQGGGGSRSAIIQDGTGFQAD